MKISYVKSSERAGKHVHQIQISPRFEWQRLPYPTSPIALTAVLLKWTVKKREIEIKRWKAAWHTSIDRKRFFSLQFIRVSMSEILNAYSAKLFQHNFRFTSRSSWNWEENNNNKDFAIVLPRRVLVHGLSLSTLFSQIGAAKINKSQMGNQLQNQTFHRFQL